MRKSWKVEGGGRKVEELGGGEKYPKYDGFMRFLYRVE